MLRRLLTRGSPTRIAGIPITINVDFERFYLQKSYARVDMQHGLFIVQLGGVYVRLTAYA